MNYFKKIEFISLTEGLTLIMRPQKPRPVSQQSWHDKRPSLLPSRKCCAFTMYVYILSRVRRETINKQINTRYAIQVSNFEKILKIIHHEITILIQNSKIKSSKEYCYLFY